MVRRRGAPARAATGRRVPAAGRAHRRPEHHAERRADRSHGPGRVPGPRLGGAPGDDPGAGNQDDRVGRQLRRLTRRDPRRRPIGGVMPAAGVVMIVAVVLIIAALVYYLVSTIFALRKITKGLDDAISGVAGIIEKSAPVNDVVTTINKNLDAGVDLLEGLLVKKAGMADAVGLVDGLYPGAAAQGFRNFPESRTIRAPRIGEIYTKGTLTLARLGREAPIAVKSPLGPALRDPAYGSRSA